MWKNIEINIQNIEVDTGKAVLINCPNKSNYKGYSFWHPSKLVRKGKNSYSNSIGYTDSFEITLIKYGKGKWNSKDKIDEKKITIEEFEKMFEIMNENIQEPNSYLEIIEPIKIEKSVEIKECLKNN